MRKAVLVLVMIAVTFGAMAVAANLLRVRLCTEQCNFLMRRM